MNHGRITILYLVLVAVWLPRRVQLSKAPWCRITPDVETHKDGFLEPASTESKTSLLFLKGTVAFSTSSEQE